MGKVFNTLYILLVSDAMDYEELIEKEQEANDVTWLMYTDRNK